MASGNENKIGSIWAKTSRPALASQSIQRLYLPRVEQRAMVMCEISTRVDSDNIESVNIAMEIHN